MKESHERMPSQPPRPRVMRRVGQLAGRSVHRGTAGLCIELRNPSSAVAVTRWLAVRRFDSPCGADGRADTISCGGRPRNHYILWL
jgi:hypothetical protein